MSTTKKVSLLAPIDPELSLIIRETLDYYITFPTGYDKSKSYGLVFCITGYGDNAASEYQLNKLRPYISDKYNLITVGVRYHNDLRTNGQMNIDFNAICNFYGMNLNYFNNKVSGEEILNDLSDFLVSRNIFSLDPRLSIKSVAYNGYSSFGFMPAIDHLNVLFDVINKYKIDKQNIIAFGTSYGGYVASLMAKYAPNTFSLVIDNSGFCVAQLQEIFGGQIGGVGGSFARYNNGKRYEIPITTSTLWSLDETSKFYFSDAHKMIRNLLIEDHRTPSATVYYCCHSEKDAISPINLKDRMYDLLKKYNVTYYNRVKEEDIDGRLFKNSSHGMNASLEKLFDVSIKKYKQLNQVKNTKTDFSENVTYGFPCLNKLYNFSYTEKGLEVQINMI